MFGVEFSLAEAFNIAFGAVFTTTPTVLLFLLARSISAEVERAKFNVVFQAMKERKANGGEELRTSPETLKILFRDIRLENEIRCLRSKRSRLMRVAVQAYEHIFKMS